MKFPTPVSVGALAELISAELIGNTAGHATGINEIHKVEQGDVVFVDHPKYYSKSINSAASFIIIDKIVDFPEGKALLVVDQPFEAYLKIVRHYRPFNPSSSLHSESSSVGKGTFVFPNVFIGNNVVIGENCIIHPNVSIMDHSVIGNNVIIQAATVIGSDGFYYNTKKSREVWYKKMESCGRVVIEDEAEIGAGCTIDRGVSSDTRIGRGTKIDNQVHIGHDVVIGNNCLIAAQAGIAGATTLGNGVTIWGQVGISKTLTIGDNAVVNAQSGIGRNLEGNKVYWGSPVEDAKTKIRELVWIKRIPELWKKVME
ncbi:MAG: UDP-3-O-(3-hydroxymyristoyl)glucosamine N-acyltransferase [Flavitalea sp.]